MKKLIGVSIAVLAFTGALLAKDISPELQLVPDSAMVTVGQVVTVRVMIFGLEARMPPSVGAFDLSLSFDPALLDILLRSPTPVSFGLLLGDPNKGEALTAFRLSPGVIEFAEVSLLSPKALNALHAARFTLATLFFRARTAGTASFDFTEGVVDDAFGNKLVEVIPEPGTLLLLGTGLAGLIGLGRKLCACPFSR